MPPEADIVKVLDLGIDPEDGAPMPMLLQDDLSAFLLFYAVRRTAEGRWEDAGVAILEFEHCMITKFEYPNDEAL